MKRMVKCLIPLFLVFCFVDLNAQQVTYSGPVEYYFEVTKNAKGEGNDGGWSWNVGIDERKIIKGSFFVTFTGRAGGVGGLNMFKLTGIEENIQFTNTLNNAGIDKKNLGKDLGEQRRSRMHNVVATRVNPAKQVITSGVLMFQNGKYQMMLSGEMDVSLTSQLSTKETYPKNKEPLSLSQTTTVKFPLVISGEAINENPDYLEGITIPDNEQSHDCRKCMDGNLAGLVHGDMNCFYVSKITTSWTLVKRTDECDASITYLKGDVKINGVPADKGAIKVGAGDIIETGEKSRIALRLRNGNEIYMLGSRSKLQLINPCKPNTYNPPGKGQAVMNFLKGKVFSQRCPGSYSRQDFDSDEEWQRFKSRHVSWFRYGGAGVRGEMIKAPGIYFASLNPDLKNLVFSPPDSEKTELIPDISSIPQEADAFYIHCENGEVKDFTVVKGTLKIEDSLQTKEKVVQEGTTTNQWNDGTLMSDVIISVLQSYP